jgi:hypothetical protein
VESGDHGEIKPIRLAAADMGTPKAAGLGVALNKTKWSKHILLSLG